MLIYICVGVEYKKTLHREANWRRIIRAVRRVYHGKLTYGANWDSYEDVLFWDALDYIGIQAYFPLSEVPNPTAGDLTAGWDRVLVKLQTFGKKHQRKILFTELGYSRSTLAASQPWASGPGKIVGESSGGTSGGAKLKLRCMEVALSRLQQEETLAGVFLWKWFPSQRSISSDFTLQYAAMRAVIFKRWGIQSAHKKTMRRSLKKTDE